jgi:hypothetical protein
LPQTLQGFGAVGQPAAYFIQTGGQPHHALRGETLVVVTYPDHRIKLLHGEEALPLTVFDPTGTVMAPDFYPCASFR